MSRQDRINMMHRRAMEHVDAAHYYASLSDSAKSAVEIRRALELEEQAVEALNEHGACEPTLTILLLGAATLALQCRESGRAERHAARVLLGDGPESLKQDARDVVRAIRLGPRGDRMCHDRTSCP